MICKGHASSLRKGRYSQAGGIYLVTFVTRDRFPWFNDFGLGRIVVGVLKEEAQSSKTLAFVIMPDHVHWLVQLEQKSLEKAVQAVKSISSHRLNKSIGRTGGFWQAGFHDYALRKNEDVVALARYVVMNPLKAGLVRSLREYSLWDAQWV